MIKWVVSSSVLIAVVITLRSLLKGKIRTLIGMICQKRAALLITATTMTGGRSSLKERVTLNAKKPKTASFTLIAVLLVAAVAVGCTFTGSKAEANADEWFIDEAWALALEYADENDIVLSKAKALVFRYTDDISADVAFPEADGLRSVCVSFAAEEDGTWAPLPANAVNLLDPTRWDRDSDIPITVEADESIPDAALDYAKDCIAQQIDAYHSAWPEIAPGCKITAAKLTGLTQMNTGTAGLNSGINLYLLEYRLLVDGNIDSVLVGGLSYEEFDGGNWLTEMSSSGQPYLLLYCDDSSTAPVWNRICVTNAEEINQYNTYEMLEQYGNCYTAAAMELYHKYIQTAVVPLSAEAIAQFNAEFTPTFTDPEGNVTVNPISCFFTSYYDKTEDINIAEFLRYFPGGSAVTDETEFEALKELDNWPFRKDATLENMQLPVTKFTAEALEQVLLEHAGITRAALSGVGLDEILYLEVYDAYYIYTSDFAAGVFKCVRGEAEGSTIRLYSAYVDGVGTILTLREQDGKYLIISHQKTK